MQERVLKPIAQMNRIVAVSVFIVCCDVVVLCVSGADCDTRGQLFPTLLNFQPWNNISFRIHTNDTGDEYKWCIDGKELEGLGTKYMIISTDPDVKHFYRNGTLKFILGEMDTLTYTSPQHSDCEVGSTLYVILGNGVCSSPGTAIETMVVSEGAHNGTIGTQWVLNVLNEDCEEPTITMSQTITTTSTIDPPSSSWPSTSQECQCGDSSIQPTSATVSMTTSYEDPTSVSSSMETVTPSQSPATTPAPSPPAVTAPVVQILTSSTTVLGVITCLCVLIILAMGIYISVLRGRANAMVQNLQQLAVNGFQNGAYERPREEHDNIPVN